MKAPTPKQRELKGGYRPVEHAGGAQTLDDGWPDAFGIKLMRDHPIPLTRGEGLGGVRHDLIPGAGHTTGRTESRGKPKQRER